MLNKCSLNGPVPTWKASLVSRIDVRVPYIHSNLTVLDLPYKECFVIH